MEYTKEQIQTICKELDGCKTITEKLEYWNNNYNKNEHKYSFSSKDTTYTLISIPFKVYDLHFKEYEKTAEFSYWFIKFSAKVIYPFILNGLRFNNLKNKPLYKEWLIDKIECFNDKEKRAKELWLSKEFDIYEKYSNIKYYEEKEIIRILNDYYSGHYYEYYYAVSDLVATTYAKHKIIKGIFENELKEFNKPKKEKPELTFRNLFEAPYNTEDKINALKGLLKNNGYIDKNYIWIGRSEKKRKDIPDYQIGIPFYVLDNELKVINKKFANSKIDITNALKIWCKEFGKIVDVKQSENVFCTIRNITEFYFIENDISKHLSEILQIWKNKEK